MKEEQFDTQAQTEAVAVEAAEVLEEAAVHALERPTDPIQDALNKAAQALLGRQDEDGHWRFDLEADATIPSEYVFLQRFLRRTKIGRAHV